MVVYLKRKDIEALQAGCHAEHLLAMIGIVEVPFLNGVGHTGRIPTHNVEVSPCIDPGLGVPLHLGGASVVHWRREDGHHRGLRVQNPILQHLKSNSSEIELCSWAHRHEAEPVYLLVLLHPPAQRHVVGLGVASQGMEQKHGVLVAHLQQPTTGVRHQEGVPVVDGVPELEGEHGVCIAPLELLAQLCRGEAEAVQPVLVLDRVYDL